MAPAFDPECRACPRLAAFLNAGRARHPDYFCRPVPPFGDPAANLLIVGLAPGFHGANRSGRPFTGDHAGVLLYQTLHAYGYASRPISLSAEDGLELTGCRITNAVKCVPPENKPETAEINRCNAYLRDELGGLPEDAAILALGLIAHGAVLKALGLRKKDYPFGHGAVHSLASPPGGEGTRVEDARKRNQTLSPHPNPRPEAEGVRHLRLYDSYHCSRYNTQTHRLTPAMFRAVFHRIEQDRMAQKEVLCP
jgi:uracil-DNA glycosylase family 4